MFCPKCATQNLEGASFCRSCGANISLIPQALSGQLPKASQDEEFDFGRRGRRRHRREPSLDDAFKKVFMGIAFMLIIAHAGIGLGRRRTRARRPAGQGGRQPSLSFHADLDRTCVFENGVWLVVLAANTRVLTDGHGHSSVYSAPGT